ncbi:prolipoprotein diacylglyceryl transferase [soil metagenome]
MISTTLAYFPSPAQGVWHLGPIPIRAYALCIIIGIIAALVLGDRRWEARGGERGVIYDIALWAVPFGLIGGRMYHVMTDWKTYFGPEGAGPVAALKIWDGGLGIWGAVALGAVGAWIGCKRRGIPLPAFGDAIAPGIVLAQAIGRLGNYFNQELYGRVTTVPWGLEIFYRQDPSGILDVHSLSGVSTGQLAEVVHPTFLYELLWNLLVFAFLLYVDRRFTIGHGRLFALYVAGYCVGRFCVELLRDDTATLIAGIRVNSFTSTFVFIGAVVYFILAPKGREDPASLRGNADEETLAEELVDELAAVAAITGVVAAATVAGREDSDDVAETEAEAVVAESVESEPSPAVDADDVEGAAEDEAIVEAGAAAPDVETETAVVAEDADLIDEDHDPVDEEDLESLEAAPAVGGPVSEQEEELAEAEPESDDEDESVEPEASTIVDAAEAISPAEDEAIVEAEVAAPEVGIETEVVAEDVDLIDEDHDPVDEEDLEGLEAAPASGGPVSEQEEELAESDADAEADDEDELVEAEGVEPEPSTNLDAGQETTVEGEPVAVETAEPSATDADDVDASTEDEAIIEAEADAPEVETETSVIAEDAELIDEDHDPVDEEDLEEADEIAVEGAPVSEQEAELAEDADEAEPVEVDVAEGDEPEAEPAQPDPVPAITPPPTPAATASTRRSVFSRLRRRR